MLHVLRRLDTFEPRHVGAMQAYLRQSVINRIRDEVRRIGRHPAPCELPEDLASERAVAARSRRSQAEAVRSATAQALTTLSPRDRAARRRADRGAVESRRDRAAHFGMRTADAARMAVSRALRRLLDSAEDVRT